MMIARPRHIVAALLSLVVASACGSDSSVAPTTQTGSLTDAVAQLSVPAIGAAAAVSGLPGGALATFDASRCAYSATSQSFTCPTVTTSGLTFKQSFTLLDASGGKQSAYGPTTTSSVHASSSVTGTIMQASTSVTVDAQSELTLSGLLTATHTLDGTATTTLTNGTSVPTLGTVTTTTIDKLVLPAGATGAAAWPTSGTITAVTKTIAGGDLPATTLLTAKITFTGSSRATVSITTAGITKTCTVDLTSQAPSCS
jgi:hypothetical protein